ncbi:MAG: hypothetical protein ACE5IO_06725, partial [Thermoplasmata archaeon]
LPEGGHYSYASSEGPFRAYFTSSSNEEDQVRIEKGDLVLTWQTLSFGYSLDNHYTVLASVNNSTARVDSNQIRYVDFIPGMSDNYRVEWNRTKHDIVINSISATEAIPGSAAYLSFEGTLVLSESSEVWIDGEEIDSAFSTESSIQIANGAGESLYLLPPFAYEEGNTSESISGRFSGNVKDSSIHLYVETPLDWLRSESRRYPVVIDPTVTVDQSSHSEPTRYSNQRKAFFDGTYYWAFYYDGSDTVYEYSADGSDWSNTPVQAFTTAGMNQVSVWYHDDATDVVYIVGDTSENADDVYVRRGTISGTTITWGSEYSFTVGSNEPDAVAFIARATDDYIWVVVGTEEAPYYDIIAVRSTNTDDVSAWDTGTALAENYANFYLYPIILPLSGGDMYAIWYADGEIAGKMYDSGTGWSGTVDYIENTTSGLATKPPSAVVDSSYNIHLVYSNSSGAINYTKYTTSWGTPIVLNSAADNVYPTISLESTNDYLYAFWVNSSYQVWGSKWEGSSWSNITQIDVESTEKTHLTSIYSTPNPWNICWECGAGTSDPWDVKSLCIPEFDSLVIPLGLAIAAPGLIRWRNRRRKKKQSPLAELDSH